MQPSLRLFAVLLPLAGSAAGCGLFLGIDDFKDAPTTTGGAGGTGTGGTTTGGGGSTGGTTTGGGGSTGGTTTGGGGSTGGGGTGGTTGTVCTPGDTQDCYEGTPGTEGIGPCKGGQQTCLGDGSGYGPCEGQVVDAPAEDCGTPADDNCNSLSNLQDGCCIANQPVSCYTGPAGTEGVGQCKHGTVTCNANGTFPAQCPNQVLPVEEFCATPADEDCNGQNCWVWTDGKGGFGNEYASAVATESFQNRIFVTGAYNGDISFGAGGFVGYTGGSFDNVFLAQYNPDGSIGWAKGFGKNGTAAAALTASADSQAGVAIGGYYLFGDIDFGGGNFAWLGNFDGWVARYNLDGSFRSSRRFAGTGHEQIDNVKITGDGVIVAGEFDSPALVVDEQGAQTLANTGVSDMFLAKYDRMTDAFLWSLPLGGAGAEGSVNGQSMDADFVSGDIYVAGTTATTGLQIGNLAPLPAGANVFFTRIDAAGVPQWAKGFNIPGFNVFVAASSFGPYLVAVAAQGIDLGSGVLPFVDQNEIYIAHYNQGGTLLWVKAITAMGSQGVAAIAADSSGLVISGGYNKGFTLGTTALAEPGTPSSGAFVAKLDIDGNILWVHPMGASPAVALDTPHFTVMAGGFANSVDFGGGAIQATASTSDIFVGKLGK